MNDYYKIADKLISKKDLESIVDDLYEKGVGLYWWSDLDDEGRDWWLDKVTKVCNEIIEKSK
jgi:hypothetical protein